MENQPLISVIVPIYKVEKYLDRCVGSIVNQTYMNLEIILIDDGSPDNCPQKCDDWADKDNRIRVVHLTNGGAGKARNIGLQMCKGQFISFIDSDDVVSSVFIETLANEMNNETGLVECDYVTFRKDFEYSEKIEKRIVCNNVNALAHNIDDDIFKQVIWNKLYKREVVINHRFPEGKLIDDEFWTYKVIGDCQKLIHLSCKLYGYRQQDASVMHKSYSISRLQALDAKYERLLYLEKNFPELFSKATINYLKTCIYHGQMVEKSLKHDERVTARKMIRLYFDRASRKKLDFIGIKRSRRCWIILARLSLVNTCRLRNALHIGF